MASRAVGQACMHGFMGLSWAVLYGCPLGMQLTALRAVDDACPPLCTAGSMV